MKIIILFLSIVIFLMGCNDKEPYAYTDAPLRVERVEVTSTPLIVKYIFIDKSNWEYTYYDTCKKFQVGDTVMIIKK